MTWVVSRLKWTNESEYDNGSYPIDRRRMATVSSEKEATHIRDILDGYETQIQELMGRSDYETEYGFVVFDIGEEFDDTERIIPDEVNVWGHQCKAEKDFDGTVNFYCRPVFDNPNMDSNIYVSDCGIVGVCLGDVVLCESNEDLTRDDAGVGYSREVIRRNIKRAVKMLNLIYMSAGVQKGPESKGDL